MNVREYPNLQTVYDFHFGFARFDILIEDNRTRIGLINEKEEVVLEPELFNEDHCLAKFENFVDAGAVFVGKIKNAPLCKLTVSAQGKNYVLLGGVFTVPKYRNCGLAKALLNSVSQKFAAQSKKCTLFVKTENKAAIKVYEKTGFKKFCNFEILYY